MGVPVYVEALKAVEVETLKGFEVSAEVQALKGAEVLFLGAFEISVSDLSPVHS